ncbi:MAG: hypothetical protein LQ337_008362 [Flavoplaca oasis]|nr:MAG: hypothetical protein LQ337_008362 [Flavoplaca oasis]
MLAPSSTSLGINCRGSFFCSYGPWSHDRPSLDDDIISIFALAADRTSICTLDISCGPIEDAVIYLPGEHIIYWPYGRSFLGSICAFTQGNVSSTGTNGTAIKEKLAPLEAHGCTLCGSVPLANNSNDPDEAGILTVNYIKKPDGCAGVCPPVNRQVRLSGGKLIDGANTPVTVNDRASS